MKTLYYFFILTILLSVNVKAQIFGNALRYDGVNDYVNFGNSNTFDVGTAVTYELWIRPDSGASGFLFNKLVAWQEDKQITYSGGSVGFYLFNVFGGTILYSTPTIPELQYTHIAATYDGSEAKIYINGVLDTSKFVGSGVRNSSGNFFTGFNPERLNWLYPYKGIIDEFRMWNIARSESEIQSTMNQPLNGNEAGLTGYWKFDEGIDTITYDATSNHNDGAISGATWVISGILSVESNINDLPEEFSLYQNYPNPFNPTTTIRYSIPSVTLSGVEGSLVTLKIYDVLGSEVATLVNEYKPAGVYEVEFGGHSGLSGNRELPSRQGSALTSGIYFYKLQAGSFVETKKMLMIK